MTSVRTMAWNDWFPLWCRNWHQGQHATLIGPTNCGKTTLATELVKARTLNDGYVIAFGTKPEDDSMRRLMRDGWKRIEKWPPGQGQNQVLLWPKMKEPEGLEAMQRQRFLAALNGIYKQGRWCLWLDELYYMSVLLNLRRKLQTMYTHARSLKISMLGATQRPAWVPLEAYSQAGHLIMWRTGDERDLRRIGSLNGISAKEVETVVSSLGYREFLHVDLVKQTLTVSSQDLKERKTA